MVNKNYKYFTEEEKKDGKYESIKRYKLKNKEKINEIANEKIKCECGRMVQRSVIARHRKTNIHLKKI